MAVNPRTFFDFTIDGENAGRVVFELFKDIVPKTAEKCLCTGEKGLSESSGKRLHYAGSPIHRVIDGFMVQGGDITMGNGKGGESIYGRTFDDENFDLDVDKEGLLVMANRGPNTNSSQFFITVDAASHLNGKHVVFGRVIYGYDVVKNLSKLPTGERSSPEVPATISKSGELEMRKKPVPAKKERRSSSKRSRSASVSSVSASSGSESDSGSESNSDDDEARSKRGRKKRRGSIDSNSTRSKSRSLSVSSVSSNDSRDDRSSSKKSQKKKKKSKSSKHKKDRSSDGKKRRKDKKSEDMPSTESNINGNNEGEKESAEAQKEREEKQRKLKYLQQRAQERNRYKAERHGHSIQFKGRGAMKYNDNTGSSKLRGWN